MKKNKADIKDFLQENQYSIVEKAAAFYAYCEKLKENNHYHYKRVASTGSLPVREVKDLVTGDIKEMYYLASNDYLNLTNHPGVIEAGVKALYEYGAGAGSVPLLGGTLEIHEELARKIAAFKKCEDAILYTSGFGANSGSLSALLGPNDLAILDMLTHASIIDGCSRTNKRFFAHNDMKSLETILKSTQGKYKSVLIAVDGVYSMDGDIAPLDKIYELAKKYGAYIYVDEAHASGVIGEKGRGTPSHFGLEGKIDFVAGTFSKGLGCVGGFVATSKEFAHMLNYFARNFMFSTAMTPQVAGSAIKAIEIVENTDERRERLWRNIEFFREGLITTGFTLNNCETAIFPIILGSDILVWEATRMLHDLNVYVNPVTYPAVAAKKSRIRMSLMSEFTTEQLSEVLNRLEYVGNKLKIIRKQLKNV